MITKLLAATIASCGVIVLAAPDVPLSDAMPVAQQNALVQKYCAVCHTDVHRNGGLSLQHFDAAHPDPGLVAMMVSKIKAKAMNAAGIPPPDSATQDALLSALSAEAEGANGWTVNRVQNPTNQAPAIIASIVREVPSTANYGGEPDMYRLQLTCRVDTHAAEMQLAWSPGVPHTGQIMSAAWDGQTPSTYKIEGREKMGNGAEDTTGPGAVVLNATSLPAKTLTIRNLFQGETVAFPFGHLTQAARQALSTCFTGSDRAK